MAGSSNTPNVILTRRDRHLLDELATVRIVDREQAMLLGGFNSITRANARLLALTRAGYLRRTFVGTINGGRNAIYSLPGRSLLARSRGPLAREKAFAHQLAVNRVYLAFKYAPAPQPGIQFRGWQKFDEPISSAIPLIPDAWVKIETPTETISAGVEVDLATEALRIWDQKVHWYLDLALTGEHRRLFGEERFRVLVVVAGRRRLESIRGVIARHTEKMFWLTTVEQLNEQGPWAPVWSRPADTAGRDLSEALQASMV